MNDVGRPRPVPSELTRPFWEAAAQRKLVRQRCDDCGRSFFTPQLVCPHCLCDRWSWVESSGFGTVYSYTVCHRSPEAGFDVPYVLAIVDLEEDWSMLSNIVNYPPDQLQIGMSIGVTWVALGDGMLLPVFEPRDNAPSGG
jgi:uncharacterized protein